MYDIFERPHADPSGLFLCTSPWPMLFIISAYLLFVLKLGKKFMENRKPYDLRRVLKVYNLMQVLYNGALFLGASYYLITQRPHNLSCLTVMTPDNPLKSIDRMLSYAYYINKFIDLLDTVFIVLRKNYKQISALHLLHHLYMPVCGYYIIRFNGFGGHIIVTGLLNLFVHIFMYGYYYLASQNPLSKRNLWWKRYITILQMVQFVIIFAHSAWTLVQPNCQVSRHLLYMALFITHADPVKLPLTDGWSPMLIIVGSYLIFVLNLGRQFMSHRQPYDLKNVLKVYNLVQILYNAIVFIAGTYYIFWESPYKLSCLTVLPLDHPLKMTERVIFYSYYMNKIVDLLDTIFIVLRKSYRQISALHLIHHVYMVVGSYVLIRYNGYGGQVLITGYLNVFVHSVMYGYYYLSSQYPLIKQSLWWKKYITILQMVQFLLIFAHNTWTYMQPSCGVSPYIIYLVFFMSSLMFVMFTNFYIQAYVRRPKKKQS
ncbi:hypothetical protein ACLKA6_017920 [Drosophila palustris]